MDLSLRPSLCREPLPTGPIPFLGRWATLLSVRVRIVVGVRITRDTNSYLFLNKTARIFVIFVSGIQRRVVISRLIIMGQR